MKTKNTTPSKEFQNLMSKSWGKGKINIHKTFKYTTIHSPGLKMRQKSRQKIDPNVMTIADIKNKIQNRGKSTF